MLADMRQLEREACPERSICLQCVIPIAAGELLILLMIADCSCDVCPLPVVALARAKYTHLSPHQHQPTTSQRLSNLVPS